jgi:exonuclease SbcC
VDELLGLDRLDALELGIHPGHDLRNARRLAPIYDDVERKLALVEQELTQNRAELGETREILRQSEEVISRCLAVLQISKQPIPAEYNVIEDILTETNEESALIALPDYRRQLSALELAWAREVQNALSPERVSLQAVYQSSTAELSSWRNQYSIQIAEVLAR